MSRPPLPPFTAETAAEKARLAEDAWNSRDPRSIIDTDIVDSEAEFRGRGRTRKVGPADMDSRHETERVVISEGCELRSQFPQADW